MNSGRSVGGMPGPVSSPRRSDWVKCVAWDRPIGMVRRVAKDGSWADVDWGSWTKRMRTDKLEVVATIPFMGGTVTDMQREVELRE